jgi:hypothetical protein
MPESERTDPSRTGATTWRVSPSPTGRARPRAPSGSSPAGSPPDASPSGSRWSPPDTATRRWLGDATPTTRRGRSRSAGSGRATWCSGSAPSWRCAAGATLRRAAHWLEAGVVADLADAASTAVAEDLDVQPGDRRRHRARCAAALGLGAADPPPMTKGRLALLALVTGVLVLCTARRPAASAASRGADASPALSHQVRRELSEVEERLDAARWPARPRPAALRRDRARPRGPHPGAGGPRRPRGPTSPTRSSPPSWRWTCSSPPARSRLRRPHRRPTPA